MTDASSSSAADPSRKQRLIETVVVMVITLGLDLWSKAWAWENLRNARAKTVVENWFYFEFGFNTGAAFSFLRDASYARMVFIGVTILALLYMARLAWTMPTKHRSAFMAVALVAGGALGNLHDRLVRQMEIRGDLQYGVVDFIKVFYWDNKPWPTFNIADVALVVGVALLFIYLTRHGDPSDDKSKADAELEADDESKADDAPAEASA
ncbi:MAG: signal peptidase II [Nannocystaceae bacterium]|nr:signal peptidase II [bacterium]